jgi:hypothetical protein
MAEKGVELQCRSYTSLSLLGALKPEWPFRIVPSWAEMAQPLTSHTSQSEHLGVTLVMWVLHSWEIPQATSSGSGIPDSTHCLGSTAFEDGLFLWWPSCLSRHRVCQCYSVPSNSFDCSSYGRFKEICSKSTQWFPRERASSVFSVDEQLQSFWMH